MSAGVVSGRMQRDDFQIRYFWLRVPQLITSDHVQLVELESSLVDVVDDVVVQYKEPGKQDNGGGAPQYQFDIA